MFKYIKFFLQKITSAKYVKRGKCRCCGACCRNILLYSDKNLPVISQKQFDSIKEFDRHFKNFYISGRSETGELLFTCRELDENNRCKVYLFRGIGCRQYPKKNTKFLINGGKPLDGCGYYFEPDKTFKSFLR